MQIKYDPEVDGIFFVASNAPVHTSEEIAPGIVVDRDKNNNIVAVEILNFSQRKDGIDLPIVFEWMNNEQSTAKRTTSPA